VSTETTHLFAPGDSVLALLDRDGARLWQPGTIRSVGPEAARVDLGGPRPRQVPLSRLRLSAVR
jgi:hypothetical protein